MNGGTTVSGTMLLAHLAGIKVFVTGGIGGVHRGATTSASLGNVPTTARLTPTATALDVSSDLTELAKTPVAVVCAGAKSILDIGLTLEYLVSHPDKACICCSDEGGTRKPKGCQWPPLAPPETFRHSIRRDPAFRHP